MTRYFCGKIGSYDNFLDLIITAMPKLPSDWVIVAKRHPLEEFNFNLPGVIYANDAHINDLLDMATCVLTFNSGVGVLAMAWGKPVFYAGDAFYADNRLNRRVLSGQDLIDNLEVAEESFAPDKETILRFYSYLINNFYSFGEFKTRLDKLPDGSNITSTRDINFYLIRNLTQGEIRLSQRKKAEIGWNSFLFDRYRFAENVWFKEQRALHVKNDPKSNQAKNSNNKIVTLYKKPRIKKLMTKLVKEPKRFFLDSKYKPLKTIGKLL